MYEDEKLEKLIAVFQGFYDGLQRIGGKKLP